MCYSDNTSLESVSSRGEILILCDCSCCLRHSASDQRDWERVFWWNTYFTILLLRYARNSDVNEHKIFNYPILKTECVNVWAHVLVNSYCIHPISYVKHIVFWNVVNSQGVKTRNRDCRCMQQNMWTVTKEKMVMKYVRVCEC